eukprot:sb/3463476/
MCHSVAPSSPQRMLSDEDIDVAQYHHAILERCNSGGSSGGGGGEEGVTVRKEKKERRTMRDLKNKDKERRMRRTVSNEEDVTREERKDRERRRERREGHEDRDRTLERSHSRTERGPNDTLVENGMNSGTPQDVGMIVKIDLDTVVADTQAERGVTIAGTQAGRGVTIADNPVERGATEVAGILAGKGVTRAVGTLAAREVNADPVDTPKDSQSQYLAAAKVFSARPILFDSHKTIKKSYLIAVCGYECESRKSSERSGTITNSSDVLEAISRHKAATESSDEGRPKSSRSSKSRRATRISRISISDIEAAREAASIHQEPDSYAAEMAEIEETHKRHRRTSSSGSQRRSSRDHHGDESEHRSSSRRSSKSSREQESSSRSSKSEYGHESSSRSSRSEQGTRESSSRSEHGTRESSSKGSRDEYHDTIRRHSSQPVEEGGTVRRHSRDRYTDESLDSVEAYATIRRPKRSHNHRSTSDGEYLMSEDERRHSVRSVNSEEEFLRFEADRASSRASARSLGVNSPASMSRSPRNHHRVESPSSSSVHECMCQCVRLFVTCVQPSAAADQ